MTSFSHRVPGRGFTLVELLLSMSILVLILTMVTGVIQQLQGSVTRQQARLEEFKEARATLESISRSLSEANLNSYWAYGSTETDGVNYTRQSDGHFVCGPASVLLGDKARAPGHALFFQGTSGRVTLPSAPNDATAVGNPYNLLACLGYYVTYGSDEALRPDHLAANPASPDRRRFRLMEWRLPPDKNILYSDALQINVTKDWAQAYRWFRGPYDATAPGPPGGQDEFSRHSLALGENILALILAPQYTVTTVGEVGSGASMENSTTITLPVENYFYDSREAQWGALGDKARGTLHQLPPVVRVTLIAAEERSYEKQATAQGEDAFADSVRGAFDGLFAQSAKYDEDLAAAEGRLTALGLYHRVFATNVSLRAAKWIIEEKTAPTGNTEP